jgi:predicted dehydrogenase
MAAVASLSAMVVGTGYAGQRHADALRELGIRCVGPLSARDVARDPSPLRDKEVQVVHVCSTNEMHAPLVAAAIDAGKDVVCEKPLALDVPSAVDLAARAKASGRLAVLGYNYRFHPMVIELIARIAAGEIGVIHDVRGAFLQEWLLLAGDDNWRVDAARGGASRVVADIGAHWLDLAEIAVGRKVEAVVAHVGRLHGRDTEDHAGMLVRFEGGLTGTCVLSQAAAGHGNDVELSLDGATGSVTWRHERPNELWLGRRDGARVLLRDGPLVSSHARRLASLTAGPNEARRNLIATVYARLAGDESPSGAALPSFDDGVRHLRFAAAALESAKRVAWVEIR